MVRRGDRGSGQQRGAGERRARRAEGQAGQAGCLLKALDAGEPKPSGKIYKLDVALKEGISQEDAKKIGKIIRDEGPKGVRAQIQGDELRVSSKKKDELQAVMTLLKGKDLDVALQFTNYR